MESAAVMAGTRCRGSWAARIHVGGLSGFSRLRPLTTCAAAPIDGLGPGALWRTPGWPGSRRGPPGPSKALGKIGPRLPKLN